MAFCFSALQFENRFRPTGLGNWEYPRFSPPRPRSLKLNSNPVCDKNGHLLLTANRDGHAFGHYRGTYELPLRITRSFAELYNACLSGRYKFRNFPRDICSCHQRRHPCDQLQTLGHKDDPYWAKPDCPNKCAGLKQIKELERRSRRCKRRKCSYPKPGEDEPLINQPVSTVMKQRVDQQKNRKRPITAFTVNRRVKPVDSINVTMIANEAKKAKTKT